MTVDYTVQTKQKLKRVQLATFLCAIAACVTVALLAFVVLFTYFFLSEQLDILPVVNDGFGLGMVYGLIACAMNWFVGYLTIPVTMLFLYFTVARLARQHIVERKRYMRRCAILGAILVSVTLAVLTPLFAPSGPSGVYQSNAIILASGATFSGVITGAVSGLIIGWLFHAIVRPANQVMVIDESVF